MTCWFRQFTDTPCDGRPQRAHLIPQQRLRRAGIGTAANDERSWVFACHRHHHQFDFAKTIRLDLDDYPVEFREFAQQHGFFFDGPAGGWKVMTHAN